MCWSRTEEDYNELIQLLEDIHAYQRDVLTVLNKERADIKKKEREDKECEEEMRMAAMEMLSGKLMNLSFHVTGFHIHHLFCERKCQQKYIN